MGALHLPLISLSNYFTASEYNIMRKNILTSFFTVENWWILLCIPAFYTCVNEESGEGGIWWKIC